MYNLFLKIAIAFLIVSNVLLLAIIAYFSKGKKERASKIGFGFMEIVYIFNILALGWAIV